MSSFSLSEKSCLQIRALRLRPHDLLSLIANNEFDSNSRKGLSLSLNQTGRHQEQSHQRGRDQEQVKLGVRALVPHHGAQTILEACVCSRGLQPHCALHPVLRHTVILQDSCLLYLTLNAPGLVSSLQSSGPSPRALSSVFSQSRTFRKQASAFCVPPADTLCCSAEVKSPKGSVYPGFLLT